MDHSPLGSSVRGILQARVLECQGTFQRSAGRPEATRSPAPPLPPCRVPGTPPNPSNNWRAPSRRPAPCLCPSGHGTWGRSTVLADLRACGGPEVPAGPPWPESAVSPGGWAGPGEGGLGVGRGPPPAPLPGVWGRYLGRTGLVLPSHGMWDLPRPGITPVSPALTGRFSTTVLGKSMFHRL